MSHQLPATRMTNEAIRDVGRLVGPWFGLVVLQCRCCWWFCRRDAYGRLQRLEVN